MQIDERKCSLLLLFILLSVTCHTDNLTEKVRYEKKKHSVT